MKWYSIFILLLIVTAVVSKKAHRRKEKKHLLKDTSPEKDILDFLQDDEKDDDEKKKKHTLENDELILEKFDTDKGGYAEDPCAKHKCGPGKQCEIDEEGKAQCICVQKCPEEEDSRRKVCSNHNETWDSDCELYRMRCLCTEGLDECKLNKYKHVHIDYYGPCKVMSRRKQRSAFDQVSEFDRGRIVTYRDWGLSFREIGSRVGRNQTTVMRTCDSGCRRDKQILRMAVTDRSVTSRTVAQHIESVTHHSVSARTIRRRLQQSGLSARRPLLGLPLTQNHRRLRRQWCDERRM
ncbi:secreted protein acidic and rich in cysteine [Trichonephila clavipes]|nr:secreted protein acidic and rich in cysteine [Trichonephila clavipes]